MGQAGVNNESSAVAAGCAAVSASAEGAAAEAASVAL
jgi:hypothetical protein